MKDLIKQDINFMEYPLWMQDEKLASKSEDGYVWKDIEGFIYRTCYKPPVKTDFVFLLYFLLQSQKNEWNDEIVLTRYEVLEGCGIKRNKTWYARLEESLERWKMVAIKFEGTFYDDKEYQTMSFGIIDAWDIEKKTKKLRIRFSPEYLLKIRNSNYFKYIDFDQIKSLRSPLVVRLFEILVKSFQGRDVWEIDVMKLAKKIPINRKYPSDVIPKIEAAVNRINGHSDLKIKLRVKQIDRGKAKFVFRKISKEKAENEVAVSFDSNDKEFESLVDLIPQIHREKKSILEAISKVYREKGYDCVKRNIEYSNKNCNSNYRAYLVKALEQDWGKILQEDREAKEKIIEGRKVTELEAKKKRQEEDLQREREKKITDRVKEYIKNLSSEKFALLREKAMEELDPSLRKSVEMNDFIGKSAIKFGMEAIVRRELGGGF